MAQPLFCCLIWEKEGGNPHNASILDLGAHNEAYITDMTIIIKFMLEMDLSSDSNSLLENL